MEDDSTEGTYGPAAGALSVGSPPDPDELVGEWLADLDRTDEWNRPDDLLSGYRDVALEVLEAGSRPGVARGERALREAAEAAEPSRALAALAVAVRRSGLTISQTIEDLSRLTNVVLAWLDSHIDVETESEDILRTAMRTFLALQDAKRRVVRILEQRGVRAERERSYTLAAMTDQLSHELRNRLGAAQTAVDMLLNPTIAVDEEGLRHVAHLVRSSIEAALRTVGDVRALVATRSDLHEPQPRPVPLARLVRGVLDELTPNAIEAGVELVVDGAIPACVVDPARMRLIVYNLVGNGIKYRDRTKRDPCVRLQCERRTDGTVMLRTIDNGIGIDPDDLEDIFLYRARGAEAHDVPGSGLGLAIVSEAVDQMGAQISVTSEPGVGSTFSLVFNPPSSPGAPASPIPAVAAERSASSAPARTGRSVRRHRGGRPSPT
jgi:signal transduction histidine kinase